MSETATKIRSVTTSTIQAVAIHDRLITGASYFLTGGASFVPDEDKGEAANWINTTDCINIIQQIDVFASL